MTGGRLAGATQRDSSRRAVVGAVASAECSLAMEVLGR